MSYMLGGQQYIVLAISGGGVFGRTHRLPAATRLAVWRDLQRLAAWRARLTLMAVPPLSVTA